MLRVLLCGQKHFGLTVYKELGRIKDVDVSCVSAPVGDRLYREASLNCVPVIKSGTLNAATVPDNIDLIVTAHSHDFIGEATRLRAKFGGVGYHPSLLPLHRGRDAVRWAIEMGDKVTGGSVYKLSNKVDGGDILKQEHVFIPKGATPQSLWRDTLLPLGVNLLREVVKDYAEGGHQVGVRQDEGLATWQPAFDAPPLGRPDSILLEPPGAIGGRYDAGQKTITNTA